MNKMVLTIDDSKTVRMIVTRHLTPFGIQTIDAENGETGVARARESNPSVILLDYNMPVMDGYQTLIELRSDPNLKQIPVIMLTTETVKETVLRLMKLGLRDYIAKPFTRELLLQKLNPILSLYEGDEVPPDTGTAVVDAPPPEKPIVLAIDDKENILALLKEYIGDQFHVLSAGSGTTAVAAMSRNQFDFMFLDLSMPDMNWPDIYNSYVSIKKNFASPKKVVAMSLRTAQDDINRAVGMGIQEILYKPFTREDVSGALTRLMVRRAEVARKQHLLAEKGDVRILDCPSDKSPRFPIIAGALGSDVLREIDEMAEEGLSKLVISLGDGFLSGRGMTRKFINLIDHAQRLSLSIRLVAESEQSRSLLKQFVETADLPTDSNLNCALNALTG
jgi:two-component system chemotaxis response regulator CheY